jgi:hypothetical protein
MVHHAGAAEAGHGGIDFGVGSWEPRVGEIENRRIERGTTEREVVERKGKKTEFPVGRPPKRLRCALRDGAAGIGEIDG